jgi:hypothetical protein
LRAQAEGFGKRGSRDQDITPLKIHEEARILKIKTSLFPDAQRERGAKVSPLGQKTVGESLSDLSTVRLARFLTYPPGSSS